MKHLIQFSINRRFKNKITIIMHILIVAILFGITFSDHIIDFLFTDSSEKTVVYYDESFKEVNSFIEDNIYFEFEMDDDGEGIRVSMHDDITIESEYSLDALTSMKLKAYISDAIMSKWMSELSDDSINSVLNHVYPNFTEVTKSENKVSRDKMNISMFIITGIYFAMLSFSTMIANEVVYEKTSRVLELILTSVSTTTHYFSKMVIAWLTVIIQIGIFLFEAAIIVIGRNMYDEGAGLLSMLLKYNLIEVEAVTFKEFLIALDIDSNIIFVFVISIIYLLLGMVIIQMVMVCLSSFIKSIEESSALQAPVYIILLIIYYIALALNSPAKLSSGIGYIFSMTPVFSMLFMPMRLLLLNVSIYEILLGIILSVITLVICSHYGAYIYKIGILGGVNLRRPKKEK